MGVQEASCTGGVHSRSMCTHGETDKGRPERLRRLIRGGAFTETGRKSATVDEITIT